MYKKDLMAMQPLNATEAMRKTVREDIPQKVSEWSAPRYKYSLFARCLVEQDVLKVALFFPDALRTGGQLPSYEVFLNRAEKKFITYDRMEDKWREATADHLKWPRYISSSDGTWMSPDDKETVKAYLGGKKAGYSGVLEYQEKLREEALERRHRKETDPWDADLSLTPGLPRDWDRWVDKVGIPQNYIFYHYRKRGAKQGFCTYCGKEVPLTVKPRHNKTGRCLCCRHEITFKAAGKQSRLSTGLNCVYLLQPRPDGFVIREFWAERFYRKDACNRPEVRCHEQKRVILDLQLNRRTYYMGLYKNKTYRWIAGMPSTSYYSPEATVIVSDIHSFAALRLNENTGMLTMDFTWLSGSCGGNVSGWEESVTVPYDKLLDFMRESTQESGPKEWKHLSVCAAAQPKLVFHAQKRLRECLENKTVRGKLVHALRDNFKYPHVEQINFYYDFAPYSFFFQEVRNGCNGISGGLIFHNYQNDLKKAYYSVHT